mmetsp:Transcript_93552/g.238192  ORF Transcript_93552/g.238192 Transcript_93552/m.238192 type:complete len:307 (-) Transcript_93552:3-923(-)
MSSTMASTCSCCARRATRSWCNGLDRVCAARNLASSDGQRWVRSFNNKSKSVQARSSSAGSRTGRPNRKPRTSKLSTCSIDKARLTPSPSLLPLLPPPPLPPKVPPLLPPSAHCLARADGGSKKEYSFNGSSSSGWSHRGSLSTTELAPASSASKGRRGQPTHARKRDAWNARASSRQAKRPLTSSPRAQSRTQKRRPSDALSSSHKPQRSAPSTGASASCAPAALSTLPWTLDVPAAAAADGDEAGTDDEAPPPQSLHTAPPQRRPTAEEGSSVEGGGEGGSIDVGGSEGWARVGGGCTLSSKAA